MGYLFLLFPSSPFVLLSIYKLEGNLPETTKVTIHVFHPPPAFSLSIILPFPFSLSPSLWIHFRNPSARARYFHGAFFTDFFIVQPKFYLNLTITLTFTLIETISLIIADTRTDTQRENAHGYLYMYCQAKVFQVCACVSVCTF